MLVLTKMTFKHKLQNLLVFKFKDRTYNSLQQTRNKLDKRMDLFKNKEDQIKDMCQSLNKRTGCS